MRVDLIDFLDVNQKLYINSNTGKGKTLIMTLLALLFLDNHPNFKGIANYHLNIFDNKTDKPKFVFSKYSLLPFDKLLKGNYIILIDDFIAIKQEIQNYGSILATMSRKVNIHLYTTIHYYTHLVKENRFLFNYELIPTLTKIVDKKLSVKSKVKILVLNPNTELVECKFILHNLLDLVKGNYQCKNVYVKGNLYNTKEIVPFINERKLIEELANWSNSDNEIEQNCSIITKSKTRFNFLVREVKKLVYT